MSKIKRKKYYRKENLFKIKNISLLNQFGFNFSHNNLKFKEKIINDKESDNPMDIYCSPIQKKGKNFKIENYKEKSLSKNNKIIKKRNILQKIDFNTYSINNYINKKKKIQFCIYNNNIINYNSNLKISDKTIGLPLLITTNFEENQKFRNNKINISSSFNNFLSSNFFSSTSSPLKYFNNIKNNNKKYRNILYKNIFTNEKLKNSYNGTQKKLKPNYSDKEIQTNFDFFSEKKNINNNNNNKKYINNSSKNKEFNYEDDKDESSSNDIDDIKELEKIISKSSINIQANNKRKFYNLKNNYTSNNLYNNNNYINVINNSDNEIKNEEKNNNFILLKSLYKVKNYNIDNKYEPFFEQSKTTRNSFFNRDKNIYKYSNIESRNNNSNKNINFFNQTNNNKVNYNKKTKIKELEELIPFNNKRRVKLKKLSDLLINDSSNKN